jgi:hypothetical protein
VSRLTLVTNLPKQFTFVFLAAIVFYTVGSVYAMSTGGPGGTWPKSWPKELEPLRKQAWTWVGGLVMNTRYEIPFTDRKQFESAWPHILKVKGKGASLTLMNGPRFYAQSAHTAGVWIIMPPGLTPAEISRLSVQTPNTATQNMTKASSPRREKTSSATGGSAPIPPPPAANVPQPSAPRKKAPAEYLADIRIVLLVDGDIVDLNRILLPTDTPIDDRRFTHKKTVKTDSVSSNVTGEPDTQVDSLAFKGSGWGTVVLNKTGPNSYEGTYTDTFGGLGKLRLTFAGLTGTGRWWEEREADDRHRGGRLYEFEISPQDGTIMGKWNTTHYGYGSFVEDASFEWKK